MRTFDYGYLEKMQFDMDILSYVASIHECKGRQEMFVRQNPVELDRLVEIAKIQSTESSNKIEGIVTTGIRMKQLMAQKTTPRNRDEDEILGYRDVLNTIHENYKTLPIKASYILQFHMELYGHTDIAYGGRFKNVQNYINETMPDGSQRTRFTPVAPYETEDSVKALCDAYNYASAMDKVDELILIPTFICDFLCIHPFNDGNGRMSRLLTLLLLYQNGYDVGKYISIEKCIEKTKDLYYDALGEASANWYEGENDPTPFIRYMLRVILWCYKEFEKRVGMMNEDREKSKAYDIVKAYVLEKLGKFTISDIYEQCPSVGRSSAQAAMKKLVEEGVADRCGSGRMTFYVRKPDIDFPG